jgi:hypothetical protein
MPRPLSLVSALLVLLAGCAGPRPEVDQRSVTRVVTALASDDMRGRDSFSGDGLRAAEFVAGEFEAIGLERMDGMDGYVQRFPVYSVTPTAMSVTLNGTAVPAEHVAASLSVDSLSWSPEDGPSVTTVSADENLFQVFQRVRRDGADGFVVVPTAQREMFDRLRGFLGRPSRSLGLAEGASLVVVLSDEPDVRSWSVAAAATVSETPLVNVVGVIPGRRPDQIVLFAGHYDHVGIVQPVEGDSIANGANDNASGTTAVIELARYFKALGTPERTIVFVAFAAEESGGFGSRHFASQVDPDRIVAMFNIEMIGKPAVEGPNTAWITGFERTDFGPILQRAVEGTEFAFHPDPYPDQNLFFRSDNAVFARQGVPAHSISTTPIDVDPDYHQVTDEVETLDLAHMTNTIRAIAAGAATIISGEATPTRIDPGTVEQ